MERDTLVYLDKKEMQKISYMRLSETAENYRRTASNLEVRYSENNTVDFEKILCKIDIANLILQEIQKEIDKELDKILHPHY